MLVQVAHRPKYTLMEQYEVGCKVTIDIPLQPKEIDSQVDQRFGADIIEFIAATRGPHLLSSSESV